MISRCPHGPPWSSATLLQGRIILVILDHLSVDSQRHTCMPSLTARDFHWTKQLLYVRIWSAMSISDIQSLFLLEFVPTFWSSSCFIHRVAGPQPSVAEGTLHGMIFWRGHQHCCFRPWRCLEVNLHSWGSGSSSQLSLEVLEAQAGEIRVVSIQVELIHRGAYENVALPS